MKVSVITVCRNAERYIGATIASVLGQTWHDLEYHLIDGGSTDDSLQLIRAAAACDARIRWVSEPDAGISDAMNKGLARATGEVIAFLHADDTYYDSLVLRRVAELMAAAPERMWLTGGVHEVDNSGALIRDVTVRAFSQRRLLRNNIILHPATFVRRSAFERVGSFDVGLRYAMDYDLWLRLGAACGAPLEVLHPLANFRVHAGSISTSNRREALEEEYLVRQRFVRNPLSQIGHALYHRWRLRRLSLQRGVL